LDNLEYLVASLGPRVLSYQRCSHDIRRDTGFAFLEDQTALCTNTVYIASAARVQQQLAQCSYEPGVILLIAGAKNGLSASPWPNITVIVTDYSAGKLYNHAVEVLRERIRDRAALDHLPSGREERIADLWDRIRTGQITSHSDISSAWAELLPDIMDKYYRLSVIAADDDNGSLQCATALPELQAALPHSCLFLTAHGKRCKLILLQFSPAQLYTSFPERETVGAILEKYSLHMLIGYGTRDYSRMNTVYRLYNRANYLAARLQLEPGTRIFTFERYSMYDVIDMCAQRYIDIFGHADVLYLVHPVVIHLSRYDKEHGTNLRDVLFCYLTNNQDLKRTAELMFMHRNTVSNKLNQIRALEQLDFSDGTINQRIIFSCQVILYYENVLSQNMRPGDHGSNG